MSYIPGDKGQTISRNTNQFATGLLPVDYKLNLSALFVCPHRALTNIPIDVMLAEIKHRSHVIGKLNRQRAKLLAKIANVEAEIRAKGGEIKSAGAIAYGGKRPKNEMNLPDAMANVMKKDKAMSVAQIEEVVTKSGYKSVSSTFKTIIFQALAKDKRFKKVSRGRYTLA